MAQRATPRWINRHSYHSAEQTVKYKKLDYRVYRNVSRTFAFEDLVCLQGRNLPEFIAITGQGKQYPTLQHQAFDASQGGNVPLCGKGGDLLTVANDKRIWREIEHVHFVLGQFLHCCDNLGRLRDADVHQGKLLAFCQTA